MSRYKTQIREVINRNVVVSLALDQGYNAFLPVYDGGVDFILYRESDGEVRKVQLKGRWMIDKKYCRRDIWMAFPIGKDDWYMMPHDDMVRLASPNVLSSKSWQQDGAYSYPDPPPAAVVEQCKPYLFKRIAEIAAKAASDGGT